MRPLEIKHTIMLNEANRTRSRKILAHKIGCTVIDLKQSVFEKFNSTGASLEEIERLVKKHSISKKFHAVLYRMSPDDTPAALMIEMLNEYLSLRKTEKESNNPTITELVMDDVDLIAELTIASGEGNQKRINELIKDYPDFFDKFAKTLSESISPQVKLEKSDLEIQAEKEILDLISSLAYLLHDKKYERDEPMYLEAWIFTSVIIFSKVSFGLDKDKKEKAKEIFRNAFIELASVLYKGDAADYLTTLFNIRWNNIDNELKSTKSGRSPLPFCTYYLYMAEMTDFEYSSEEVMNAIWSLNEFGEDPKELLRKCLNKFAALLTALDNHNHLINKYRLLL